MWSDRQVLIAGMAAAFLINATANAAHAQSLGSGHTATPAEIAGWDIDVRADGQGLPPGHGSVREGEKVYAENCAACHGDKGEGKPADRLVGGFGTLASAHPVRTVGSYWPYAATLFDFIRRAMPWPQPKSLSNDEAYALSAYILKLNGIIGENDTMNADTLPKVHMPNRDGFVSMYPTKH